MSGNMEKPVCGSGDNVGEYDVGLHTLGLCQYLDLKVQSPVYGIATNRMCSFGISRLGFRYEDGLQPTQKHLANMFSSRGWIPSSG